MERNMPSEIIFSVLGGGQEVGASCYLLKIDNKKILLDCGKGIKDGIIYGPDFSSMLNNKINFSDIDAVFISHAHFDHIGYLAELEDLCKNVPVYASTLTAELAKVLLWDNIDKSKLKMQCMDYNSFMAKMECCIQRITRVSYNTPIDFGSFKATFFEAGHIPGASMIALETEEQKILYTGDYNFKKTVLTNKAALPDNFKADNIILCSLNAKKSINNHKTVNQYFPEIFNKIKTSSVFLKTSQLTKGLETLSMLTEKMLSGKMETYKIYIDESIWNLANAFGKLGICTLSGNCFRYSSPPSIGEKVIYIGRNPPDFPARKIDIEFTLHSTRTGDIKLLDRYLSPNGSVIVVHSPNASNVSENMSDTNPAKSSLAIGVAMQRSRDVNQKKYEKQAIEKLITYLTHDDVSDDIIVNTLLSLGLICDRRPSAVTKAEESLCEKAKKAIEQINLSLPDNVTYKAQKAQQVALKMIGSQVLESDDEQFLLDF